MLDEFHTADRSVRTTLSILLSGRLVTPVENEQLTVRPVPLLTLNPGEAKTLEGRLGLSAPLIRRALLVNLDAVPLPDLATAGERAVEAARNHGPLVLGAPQDDLQGFHDPIVALVRNVFAREAHERVDIEIVVSLTVGMTAFIPDPVPAIAQVAHGVGLIAETLGWARPGWIEAVSEFRRGPRSQPPRTSALARRVPSAPPEANTEQVSAVCPAPASISLVVPPSPARRHTPVPDLDLSDELRARLIWFAVDTGQSVEEPRLVHGRK
ncbi:hypothetical protein HY522_07130 [bacterium]|nr:hypothetical protein [bacterium]